MCGLPGVHLTAEQMAPVDGAAEKNTAPCVWAKLLPVFDEHNLSPVTSRAVLLPNILGAKDESPLHAIVANCDATVFESSIVSYVVQYK